MGTPAKTIGKSAEHGYGREFGREQTLNIDPTRIVGSTELANSNVACQFKSLDIEHQRVIGLESEVPQGRSLTRADSTVASLNRRQAAGERADLRSSQTHANGTTRCEEPPCTW